MEVRASEIKRFLECPQYLRHYLDGTERSTSEYVERSFFDGVIHENSILDYARHSLDIEEIERQAEGLIEIKGVKISCHADLIGRREGKMVVVEAKFLKARSIFNILNGADTYDYQVACYMKAFSAEKAYLVMRNKDTPPNRIYQHFVKEYDKDFSEILDEAIEKIIEHSKNPVKNEQSWMCSPIWCPYYGACFPEKIEKIYRKFGDIDLLISEYKELVEATDGVEKRKKEIREQLLNTLKARKIDHYESNAGEVRLRRQYRKSYLKEALEELDKQGLYELKEIEIVDIR